jgi:hypothetical protein
VVNSAGFGFNQHDFDRYQPRQSAVDDSAIRDQPYPYGRKAHSRPDRQGGDCAFLDGW